MQPIPIERIMPHPTTYLTYMHTGVLSRSSHLGLTLSRRNHRPEPIWDEQTIIGPLVTGHTGIVLARGFNHIFEENTPGFPETIVDNWDLEAPCEIYRMYDGMLGLLYAEAGGAWGICSEDGPVSETTAIASRLLAPKAKSMVWPEGFTPVVSIVRGGMDSHKIVYYPNDELILLGLVDIATGYCMDFNALVTWGVRNGIRVATKLDPDMDDLTQEPRGYVVTFPLGNGVPPLKVKHENTLYAKAKCVMADTSQASILQALSEGSEIYRNLALDKELPTEFRMFCMRTGRQLVGAASRAKDECYRAISECPIKALASQQAADWFLDHHAALWPAIFPAIREQPVDAAIWRYLESQASHVPFLNAEFV